MAELNSKQRAQVEALGTDPLEIHESGSRERSEYYEFNTTDQGNDAVAADDIINLALVPANRRLDHIKWATDGLGTDVELLFGIKGADGSGVYDDQGTADDDDFFNSTAVDVSGVGDGEVGKALAEQFGYLTTKAVIITAKVVDGGSIAVTADKNLKGKVYYAGS